MLKTQQVERALVSKLGFVRRNAPSCLSALARWSASGPHLHLSRRTRIECFPRRPNGEASAIEQRAVLRCRQLPAEPRGVLRHFARTTRMKPQNDTLVCAPYAHRPFYRQDAPAHIGGNPRRRRPPTAGLARPRAARRRAARGRAVRRTRGLQLLPRSFSVRPAPPKRSPCRSARTFRNPADCGTPIEVE